MPRIERQDEYSERIDDTDAGGDSSWQAAPVTGVCIWTAGAHTVSRVAGKDVKPSIHVEQNPVEMPATRAKSAGTTVLDRPKRGASRGKL